MSRISAFSQKIFFVAAKEFRDCLRGRWILVGILLFAVLSFAIIFGTAALGGTLEFRPLVPVLNSIISLTVFLLPLIGFLISYDAFVGEEESGTMLLMLTYPLSRFQWFCGKLLGQFCALFISLQFAFIPLLVLTFAGTVPYEVQAVLRDTAAAVWTSSLLGIISLLAGYLFSLASSSKNRALGGLLLLWLLAVLLYDLGLLILSIVGNDALAQEFLRVCLLLNPASVFRLFNQEFLGVTKFGFSYALLNSVFGVWIAGLFGLDYWLLKRKKI